MENYLEELTECEMLVIDGGSFWNDLAYGVGYIGGKLYHSLNHIQPQVLQRW